MPLLTFMITLTNHENVPIEGTIHALFGDKISFWKEVTLESDETREFDIGPSDISDLKMENPKLWWPNGYGSPNLYDVTVEFTTTDNNELSDTKTFKTGVHSLF